SVVSRPHRPAVPDSRRGHAPCSSRFLKGRDAGRTARAMASRLPRQHRKEVMRTPIAVSVLALAAALAQPAASLTIDNFEEGDFTDTDQSTPGATTSYEQSGLTGTNVVGGVRQVDVLATGTVALGTAVLTTSAADDSVAMSVVGAPDPALTMTFIYDGVANAPSPVNDGVNGALNLDLSVFSSIDLTATAANVAANVQVSLW